MWQQLPPNLTHVDAVYEHNEVEIVFFIGKKMVFISLLDSIIMATLKFDLNCMKNLTRACNFIMDKLLLDFQDGTTGVLRQPHF